MKKNRGNDPSNREKDMRTPQRPEPPMNDNAPSFAKPDELGNAATRRTSATDNKDEYAAYREATRRFDAEIQEPRPDDTEQARDPSQETRQSSSAATRTSNLGGASRGPVYPTHEVPAPRRHFGQGSASSGHVQPNYAEQAYARAGYPQHPQQPYQPMAPRIDPRTGRPVVPNGRPERKGGVGFWVFLVLELILLAGSAWLARTVLLYGVGSTLHRLLFFGGLGLVHILLILLLIRAYRHLVPRYVGIVLSVLLLILFGVAVYFSEITFSTLQNMQANGERRGAERSGAYEISLAVLAESDYETTKDLQRRKIALPLQRMGGDVQKFYDTLREEGLDPEVVEVDSFLEGVNLLYDKEVEGAVIASDTLVLLQDEHKNAGEELRILSSVEPEQVELEDKRVEDPAREPFTMYISGVDSYDVSEASRSDVNMLLTINPQTNNVLITNIPRDSYIPIQGGGHGQLDKLTHAGVYGIQSSILSLEDFMDVDINYYTRVNFNSLISLVDELGGVIIDNPYEFQTNSGEYYFPEGRISLNGETALAYVRERYNLPDGDFSRGENQQRVLEALIQKALSPEIISNYRSILNVLGDSVKTNISPQQIMKLATYQISESPSWQVKMASVTGNGAERPSYAAGGQSLSVVIPDEASVKDAQAAIDALLAD